jgi:hypothetical protein
VLKPFTANWSQELGNNCPKLGLIAAVHESAYGTKRTFNSRPAMSAFGGKADMTRT